MASGIQAMGGIGADLDDEIGERATVVETPTPPRARDPGRGSGKTLEHAQQTRAHMDGKLAGDA